MRTVIIVCFAFASCGAACAQIVENTDITAVSSPGGIVLYSPRLPDDPLCFLGACASIRFGYDGESIVWDEPTPHLGPRGDWSVVPVGSAFGPIAVTTGAYSPLFSETKFNKSYPPVYVGDSDFYLGFAYNGAYGWAHLVPAKGSLTMLGNVMSYNSPGIIIGTTTLVPEPITSGILLVGLTTFAVTFRRSRTRIRY
jgi:hypothetical protein